MLKSAGAFLSITLSLAAAMGQLSPIPTTRYDHAISAKADHGEIFIAAREMLVDVIHTNPNWRSGKGALVILFDSSSGYFHWSLAPVPKNEQTANMTRGYGTLARAYVAADRFVQFGFGYPDLVIKESTAKANNLDDAEAKALSEATRRLPVRLGYKSDDRVIINLVKLLPQGFAAPPGQPNLGPLKLLDVSHKGNTWEVILQGQWQHKITLNDKYQVTSTTRIN